MGDIFRAAGKGNQKEVTRLLDADPTLLERKNDHGDRPLAEAAFSGHLRVVTLLIQRGADINARGFEGSTALHYAAKEGAEEVVTLLLGKGAHANSRDERGNTPFMLACDNGGSLGVVKMLAQHMGGQGFDEVNEDGWTALHYAAYWAPDEVVRWLLLAGADPSIRDYMGDTPRALAEKTHHHGMLRLRRSVAVFQVRPLTS
jgi:ankyrin repeat protein